MSPAFKKALHAALVDFDEYHDEDTPATPEEWAREWLKTDDGGALVRALYAAALESAADDLDGLAGRRGLPASYRTLEARAVRALASFAKGAT